MHDFSDICDTVYLSSVKQKYITLRPMLVIVIAIVVVVVVVVVVSVFLAKGQVYEFTSCIPFIFGCST